MLPASPCLAQGEKVNFKFRNWFSWVRSWWLSVERSASEASLCAPLGS